MDKHLKECLDTIHNDVQVGVRDGKLSGSPFVGYTNSAAAIFGGFEVLLELIQVNRLMETGGDEDEASKALNQYESGTILSMMRSMCGVMHHEAGEIAMWADKRIEEGKK